MTGEFLPKTIFKINPNLVLNVFAIPLIICYVILYPISKLASGLPCLYLRVFGMKINKDASDRAFGKVDLDYFVQSSIDNAENEEELDTEVKIFQNALDFSNIKIRDCIVPRTEVVAVDLTTSLDERKPLHRIRNFQDHCVRWKYRQCGGLYPFVGNVSCSEKLA